MFLEWPLSAMAFVKFLIPISNFSFRDRY